MARLSLVIADSDERYASGLSDYINNNHSRAFIVSCFTKPDALERYLAQQHHADVLLISPDFYDISAGYPDIRLRALLITGTLRGDYPDFQVLNKYNTGEKLLDDVIHLYSKLNPSEQLLSLYSKNAELIGVYSPSGGSGKTTIAAALSRECALMGKKAFYLNMESTQSTGMFFAPAGKRNLSYIFYYLKEKSRNLSFRMDGIKSTDTRYGVQYFNPPESPLEYEELGPEEVEQLIQGLRGMGGYDSIFIDMSSPFDSKNLKIMDLCDRIILLSLQEPIAMHKYRSFRNELEKLSDADSEKLSDKLITAINRYRGSGNEYPEGLENRQSDLICIPEYSKVFIDEDGRIVIDDEGFRVAINKLIGKISGK